MRRKYTYKRHHVGMFGVDLVPKLYKYDNYLCYVVWKIIELHLLLLNLDTVVKRNVWEMSVNQQQQQTNNGDFYQVKTVICR